MFDRTLTLYIKDKVIKPFRSATAVTKRLCKPSPYEQLDEQDEHNNQGQNNKQVRKKHNEYSEPPSPIYNTQATTGTRREKMDVTNVWGGDIVDSDLWMTGSGSSGGARVDMDSSRKDHAWVMADETVKDMGNGRKVHKAKFVQKKSELPSETDLLKGNPWNFLGQEIPVEALREREASSGLKSPEKSPMNGQTREPSPQLSVSPDAADFSQTRTRHVSRWLSEVRRQYNGKAKTKEPKIRVGTRRDEDVVSVGTTDEYEWPTLLKNPANNNHNLPAMEPTGELHQLRMRILTNFGVRCRQTGHLAGGDRGGEGGQAAMCHLCAPVDDFTMLPQHGRLFLDAVLLPISESITFAEMAVHVNTCVVERLFTEAGLDPKQVSGGTSWDNIRTMPVYEDYRRALVLATHRRRVFEELPICVGKCGMVQSKK